LTAHGFSERANLSCLHIVRIAVATNPQGDHHDSKTSTIAIDNTHVVSCTVDWIGCPGAGPGVSTRFGTSARICCARSGDAPVAVTSTVTFLATQDSYLSSGFPDNNFGGAVNMNLGWQAGSQNAMRMLLQFDLSSIPRNAVINSAEYRIFQSQVLPVGDGNMDFRAQFMSRSWNENNVTWNNANFLGGQSLPIGSVPGTIGWQGGSVLEVVRAWTSGAQPNNGLLITGDERPEQNRTRIFSTRETNNRPQLIVNFTVVCDTLAPNATVQPLPQFSLGTFEVRWAGQDLAPSNCQPSGIANFDVQYNINGRGWTTWRQRTSATSATFRGDAPNGAFVQFRARATDRAGNVGQYTRRTGQHHSGYAGTGGHHDTVATVSEFLGILP
jgi:hypothetical protein